jgi:gas vesicle protein
MSAYNLYFQEERARLLGNECTLVMRRSKKKGKQQAVPHGVISFQDLSKHVGKTWRELPKDKRKRYTGMYEDTKKQYKEEMEAYDEAVQNALNRAQRKRERTVSACVKDASSNDVDTDANTSSTDSEEKHNGDRAVIVIDDCTNRGSGSQNEEECQTEQIEPKKPYNICCLSTSSKQGQMHRSLIEDEALEPIKIGDMCLDKDQDEERPSVDMELIMDALDDLIPSMETMQAKSMVELEEDLQYILEEFQLDVPEPLFCC